MFQEAVTQYTPTDNSAALQKESSSKQLRIDVKCLYVIDSVFPNLRQTDPELFLSKVSEKCPFLFHSYDKILAIWMKSPHLPEAQFLSMINMLEKIETGALTQHEASIQIGSEIQHYVSKDGVHLSSDAVKPTVKPTTQMTWREWKMKKVD